MGKRGRDKSVPNPSVLPPVVEEPQYDQHRFVSDKADKFFNDHLGNAFNVEREFDWESCNLKDIFTFYKWKMLASNPVHWGVNRIVREFYANVWARGDTPNSYVRGLEVPYTSTVINRYYSMPANVKEENCAYQKLIREMKTKEDILGHLPAFSNSFGMNIDPTWYKKGNIMKSRDLSEELAILHRFICERIMPSSHYGEVSWRRAALMHVVVSRQRINTGLIMRHEIIRLANNMGRSNFNFPILITELAEISGLNMGGNLRNLKPGSKIDYSTLTSFNRARIGPQIGQGVDDQGEREMHDMDPTEAAYYLAGQVESIEENVRGLRMEFGQLQNRVEAEIETNQTWRERLEGKIDNEIGQAQSFREEQMRMMHLMMERLPPPPHQSVG